jgi:Tol biopolymer transport system component
LHLCAIAGILVAATDAVAAAQSTARATVSSTGTQANGSSAGDAYLSADGRFAAFTSRATNLVTPDHNRHPDAFVHDFFSGTTERVSLNTAGRGPNDDSNAFGISSDARYVLFASGASDLVPSDANGRIDMFVRDRTSGTTERVSVDPAGGDANGDSFIGAISADGRFVAFGSTA